MPWVVNGGELNVQINLFCYNFNYVCTYKHSQSLTSVKVYKPICIVFADVYYVHTL